MNTPNPAGYAGQVVTHAPPWHGHVVWDLLFNNLATGLYLTAAVCELAAPLVFTRITTWAYPIALGLLLIDLVFLVLDLGDPLRFHHMLRVFKPSSPMSLGTWCLTMFSLPLTGLAAMSLFGEPGWLRGTLILAALPFAFGSAAYKGVLFSVTAQPGWKEARWCGAYLINSAILLGAAQLLLLAEVLGEAAAARLLRLVVGFLIAFNLFALASLAKNLAPTLAMVHPNRERLRWLGFVVGFTIIDLALVFVGGWLPAVMVLALVTFVCLIVRGVFVKLPHRVGGESV
jgi:Polysulphide reductase, NrfD